jgi:type VI secretion system FHA domain protein
VLKEEGASMLSLKLVRGAEHAPGVRSEVGIARQGARFVIGRDPTCDWPIPDRTLALSARHCEVVHRQGQAVLRDTSTNGTFVNGAAQRMSGEHVLRVGDRIQLGPYHLEVHAAATVMPAPVQADAGAAAPAPLARGGDPAAMLPSDWEQAPPAFGEDTRPLAEADIKTGFTRIERPPRRAAAAAPAAAPAPPAPAVAPPPPAPAARASDADPAALLESLAAGLGVAPAALAGVPAAEVAERCGRLLRAAIEALREQLEQQARAKRQLGSRDSPLLGRRAPSPLRLAPTPDDALLALLTAPDDPLPALREAAGEVAAHPARLLAASRQAGRRLGQALAPETLERMLGGADEHDPDRREQRLHRLWALYTTLWPRLGGDERAPWAEGLADQAALYLAAAYDAHAGE